MTDPFQPFLARCVSVDLEVDPSTAKFFGLAAVRDGDASATVAKREGLEPSLDRLEEEMSGAEYLLGHNILRHDLPHLAAVRPRLANIARSAIDTLWLNPLAFPRNPYHHLVKHYHDGRLHAGHINDPEKDARLVFQVLRDHVEADLSRMWTMEDLARNAGMSVRTLSSRFLDEFGCTPFEYLREPAFFTPATW